MNARERGSVTAELAAALPALILLLAVAVTAVSAVTSQLRCVDAAAQAARAAARGGDPVGSASRVAPAGARVSVAQGGGLVRVTVVARTRPLGGWLPGFDVRATATAALEPGEPGAAS